MMHTLIGVCGFTILTIIYVLVICFSVRAVRIGLRDREFSLTAIGMFFLFVMAFLAVALVERAGLV